jgi:hypothetical protein
MAMLFLLSSVFASVILELEEKTCLRKSRLLKTQGVGMGFCNEDICPANQKIHSPQACNASPAEQAEDNAESVEIAYAQRLQYLELLAKLGIPLVMEGIPAEAFFVR